MNDSTRAGEMILDFKPDLILLDMPEVLILSGVEDVSWRYAPLNWGPMTI